MNLDMHTTSLMGSCFNVIQTVNAEAQAFKVNSLFILGKFIHRIIHPQALFMSSTAK